MWSTKGQCGLSQIATHTLEEGHQFDLSGTRIMARASNKTGRELLEAWVSDSNFINRHVDIPPCNFAIRTRDQKPRPGSRTNMQAVTLRPQATTTGTRVDDTRKDGVSMDVAWALTNHKCEPHLHLRVANSCCFSLSLTMASRMESKAKTNKITVPEIASSASLQQEFSLLGWFVNRFGQGVFLGVHWRMALKENFAEQGFLSHSYPSFYKLMLLLEEVQGKYFTLSASLSQPKSFFVLIATDRITGRISKYSYFAWSKLSAFYAVKGQIHSPSYPDDLNRFRLVAFKMILFILWISGPTEE
ncbi:unnamed protein product [Dibothriocephalus latus]|uniref:Uncharacterized protein n=1 Tax=Dibothriocephalus latus TaxID=60516 RepID=A0A3P7NSE2_DIBLA|nr:unnamed protein product [Dibothriocephalus latus]